MMPSGGFPAEGTRVKAADEFVPLLGPPIRSGSEGLLRLAQRWDVEFPVDMVDVLSAYGDCEVDGHLNLYGPATLEKMSTYRPDGLYPPTLDDADPRPVFPRPAGLLEWATSCTGDAFCLRRHAGGLWTVSTYDNLVYEWTDYELGLSDWLHAALSTERPFDILPPIDDELPLTIKPLDIDRLLTW